MEMNIMNFNLSEKTKKSLLGLCAVAIAVVVLGSMILNPGPEHIKDTNGADNYNLQQITERDVVSLEMGSRGSISTSETNWNFEKLSVSSGIKYSSKKFTGVYSLYNCTIFKGSDIHVYLPDFKVKSGNFAFYVILDGKVVGEVKPDEFGIAEFILDNIDKTATLEYIIAGESANFKFTAPENW